MTPPAPAKKRVTCLAAVVALVATSALTWPVAAQVPISTTLSRYRLERYFADSLQSGTQRVVAPSGTVTRITAANTIPLQAYVPTRVAAGAVVDQPTAQGDTRVVLPDRAFVATSGADGMLLVPVIIIEGGGLRFRNGAFRGSIRVGIEDSLQTAGSVPLPSPIRFFVSGTADSITLPDTAVQHTNLPYPAINLVMGARATAVSLNVRTTLNGDSVPVDVPVVLDPLPLAVTPIRVQGMGLEETRVVLGPAPSGAGVVVQLTADNGSLAANEVTLSENGTATTTLRSYSFGRAVVTARSVPFADTPVSVDFAFPWLFLAASVLGGAVGGLAAWLQKRQQSVWTRRVARGALLGLIAAVLYAVGVNVTPVTPAATTGQAVVFGLAALIGYLGTIRVPGPDAAAAGLGP